MAQQAGESSGENMPVIQKSDELTYHQRVAKALKPLEDRWDYAQSVLLWKKPTHSLCFAIAVNLFFRSEFEFCFYVVPSPVFTELFLLLSCISTGWFRVFLIGSMVVASSLLVEDVRGQAWHVLQQGGISPKIEGPSSDDVLSFSGVCDKVVSVWQYAANGYTKLCIVKSQSMKKFYGILFCIILILVYAYQYLPILQILYITICALFFQPAFKYYGVGKVVQKGLEPFYKPFMVQWQHSRTKRERSKVLKEVSPTADSDEEFASKLNPDESNATQPHLTDNDSDGDVAMKEDNPDEPMGLALSPSDAVWQESESTPEEPETTSSLDTPSLSEISRSASLDNTESFIEGLDTLPSVRTGDESLEENDFMEGLEFPDIGGEPYHSSNESLNLIDGRSSISAARSDTASQPVPASISSSQQSSLDVSDFEVVDRSEAEGLSTRNGGGTLPASISSVSSYVGKWLGY